MDANKLKVGHKILLDGQPYKVVDATRRQQPRLAAKIVTKLLNLLSGALIEKTFTSGENLQEADISRVPAQYIYSSDDIYVFMDLDTSDQFEFNKDKLGDSVKYLIEGTDVTLVKFNDRLIDIELPLSMTIEIEMTEPAVKGDSVNNVLKPATLVTGYDVQVPLFINSGDSIIINTETGEYKGRAK